MNYENNENNENHEYYRRQEKKNEEMVEAMGFVLEVVFIIFSLCVIAHCARELWMGL